MSNTILPPPPPHDLYAYRVIDGATKETLFEYEGFRRYTPEISRNAPFVALATLEWGHVETWALKDDSPKTIGEIHRFYRDCEEKLSSFRVLS